MKKYLRLLPFLLLFPPCSQAQAVDSTGKTLMQFQGGKYINQADEQVTSLDKQLTSKSQQYLQVMAAEEGRLKSRLQKTDSGSAAALFGDVNQRYGQLQAAVAKGLPTGVLGHAPGSYIPSLDSMKNTLLFLQSNKEYINSLSAPQLQKLTSTIGNVQTLESRIQAVDNLKSVLQQREQFLDQQLNNLGMAGQLGKMKQTVYYYKQQVNDLKESIKDPTKMQQKAMAVLSQLPAYKQFLNRHSYLSRLFGTPEDYNLSDSGMNGLQTRAVVLKMIQQKMPPGGSGASSQLSQQMQQASTAVSQLQSKIAGGGSNEPDPGFTPNGQKTKSLWKRLVYGANVQFEPATTLLPTLADMALSLGYRLNDRATIGVGAAWKTGLGNGIQHIQFSGQGLGLRSYIDWKWKKNYYLSGGYEENYLSSFQSLQQLRVPTGWQKSGLVGLSREYQVSKKVKGKAQLLFDFLSFYQIPRAQPVVFRVGWSF